MTVYELLEDHQNYYIVTELLFGGQLGYQISLGPMMENNIAHIIH